MQGKIIISTNSKLWSKYDTISEIENSKINNNNNNSSSSLQIKEQQQQQIKPTVSTTTTRDESNIIKPFHPSPLSQLSKSKSISLYGSFDLPSSSSSFLLANYKNKINNNNNKSSSHFSHSPTHLPPPLFGSFSSPLKNEIKSDKLNKNRIDSFTSPIIISTASTSTTTNQAIQKNHKNRKRNNKKKKNKRKRNNSKIEIKSDNNIEIEKEDIKLTFSNYDSILLIDDRIKPFKIVNTSKDCLSTFIINNNENKTKKNLYNSFLVSSILYIYIIFIRME